MLFQIYGDNAMYQLLGWVLVFAGLVICNEIARRTKAAEQPDTCIYERLVPLREAVCGSSGLYRFHDDQVQMGCRREGLVQAVPVRHRCNQHFDCGRF